MYGLPTPDFDSDDNPLTPISSPIGYGSLSQVPQSFGEFCESKGFEINVRKPLRSTGNSTVFVASLKQPPQQYAFKVSRFLTRIFNEYCKRNLLPDSEFLVKSYQVLYQPSFAILQMELCSEGDLNGKTLEEKDLWKLILNVSCGLEHIHEANYIHLDISPSNILYDGRNFKISDFGTLIEIGKFEPGMEGAGPFVSPEILNFQSKNFDIIGPSTDIFSFGVVLLELASGYYAPRGGDHRYEELRKGKIQLGGDLYSCQFGQDLISLVNHMLLPNPQKRPTANDIFGKAQLHTH